MSARRAVVVVGLLSASLLVGGSCGIPADESFQEFDDEELPRELTETTTTTTTTVPPATTSTLPTDSTPPNSSTTLVQTQPVDVYFVIGIQLQPQSVPLLPDVSPAQVIAQLVEGPIAEGGVGLRSVVRDGLVNGTTLDRGVLTIDLNGDVLARTSQRDQPLAIAQLALSLSRLGGVGQVTFQQDGEPLPVPVPARDGEFSEPGEPLVFDDFAPLLASTSASVGTTTTTTLPEQIATTVPAPPATDPAATQPPG